MTYPAHILPDNPDKLQTVEEHCRGCAERAALVSPEGLRKTAYLAGLLHDMGKYTDKFREYITRAAQGERVQRGSVNHSFAAVHFIMERWYDDSSQTISNLTSEVLAFAVGSHHGLFDCVAPDGKDGFLHRSTKEGIDYEQARDNFLAHCAGFDELDALHSEAQKEISALIERLYSFAADEPSLRFYLAMLSRLVLSAVIEGDRHDTTEFMLKPPPRAAADGQIWERCLARLEVRLTGFPAVTPIDRARREISDLCLAAAGWGSGIYRLSVPTGGGKTLAGLRYSLAAAKAQGKRRIFHIIPLLSVLEQNIKVIRGVIDDDSLILEHHSNIIQEKTGQDELDENELLTDSWNAPIVVTTLVQLLNTLFLGKSSSVRRMQALCDSVIVIDEVQSVPRNMLSLFNLAINFLSEICGATVVLCSATQPCLEKAKRPIRYRPPEELAPCGPELWGVFRRTEIVNRCRAGGYSAGELAELGADCLKRYGSVLIICNTKAQARDTFNALGSTVRAELFHLSTSMCMAHRIETLRQINGCLDAKRPVVCVSTQLVEAGVDFSFGCVIRVKAGLDNVIQAAGRCNRGGEFDGLRPVYIVDFKGENLRGLKEIQVSQGSLLEVLECHADGDLGSDEAVATYYRHLYANMSQNGQDYPVEKMPSLFELLSRNAAAVGKCPTGGSYLINQAYRTAGELFSVFDDNTTDILVPYGGGAEVIAALGSADTQYNPRHRGELLNRAKPYTISIYDTDRRRLEAGGALYALCGGAVLVLRPEFYTEKTGLDREGANLEVQMI